MTAPNTENKNEKMELDRDEMVIATGGTFTPNRYGKCGYQAVGISTSHHFFDKDEFRFNGMNITYEQANRIVAIANKVDSALNTGYRDNDKVRRNEPAFLRAFNSQLQIEFGMTWDGTPGQSFSEPNSLLPWNVTDPFAPGFPGLT